MDKLRFFKKTDIGIEAWLDTACEYKKQKNLTKEDIPNLLAKLYSLKEMVDYIRNHPNTNFDFQPDANEKITLTAHGKDEDLIYGKYNAVNADRVLNLA